MLGCATFADVLLWDVKTWCAMVVMKMGCWMERSFLSGVEGNTPLRLRMLRLLVYDLGRVR